MRSAGSRGRQLGAPRTATAVRIGAHGPVPDLLSDDPNAHDSVLRVPITALRVLLLNATHEPLAIVTGRRALVLILAGKAECLVERDRGAHSPTLVLAVPAVVRLHRFVRVPYQPATAVTRTGVLRRDRRSCAYCGGRADTIDHVVPRSRGGGHSWENCVACCVRCNSRKADRLLDELGWSLRFRPSAPARTAAGRVWLADDADPAWEPWLPQVA
jgi:5-methylcytosine-specific restriction endonuclease McrA